ncbi:MAG: glycosyltransferase family 4 protein [Muribaculaceae bacterium]|nr:glycosyltransferase family 4 protein [Muribaculaceae bacterium]
MNILLINHYAGNPKLGMEFRPYYLGREWVKSGNKVMIIGGSYSHLRKQQPTEERETLDGIEYRWTPLKPYKGNGLGRIKSMFDFVRKLWFSYSKYLGDFKPDVVIASSTYPIDIYPAHKIAKHYGAKLVYEVHDLWPLSPMELGGYSKQHPFIMVMQAAEDYCYRHADKVVSLLPNALEHMKERGMDEKKFVYVPNGYVQEEWSGVKEPPKDIKDLVGQLKSDGKFVIMYTGGHAISNALDFFLDAMKKATDSNVVALLIGNGQEKSHLETRVKDEKIDNVIFLNPVPKQLIPGVLSLADCLYIGWKKNPLYRFGICPNKLLDYMMSGKPIIHSVTAPNDWVKDGKCGISVEAENAETLAKAIKKITATPKDELIKLGKQGKQFCQSKFNYKNLAEQFIKFI